MANLLAMLNASYASGNFSSDKSFPSTWAFVIEKNPITSKHIVRFTIIDYNPIGVQFRCALNEER